MNLKVRNSKIKSLSDLYKKNKQILNKAFVLKSVSSNVKTIVLMDKVIAEFSGYNSIIINDIFDLQKMF